MNVTVVAVASLSGFKPARYTMNLQDDDFTLFGLPRRYAQDPATIDAHWKALQRQAHPDKFAAQGASAQRLAMQWSVRINEARQRLKDPLQRASYLCQLHGIVIDTERNTAMPAQFLMQQMEWREALEEASRPADLLALHNEVQQARQCALQTLEQAIDQQQDFQAASASIQALMFMQKFANDLQQRQRCSYPLTCLRSRSQ